MAAPALLVALLVAQAPPPAPSEPPLIDAPAQAAPVAPVPADDVPRARGQAPTELDPEPEGFIGLDASQWARRFGHPPPSVDPLLLAWAPTSPQTSMWSALGTTLTGTALLMGSVFLSPRQFVGPGPLAGIALMNFGPGMGDLLNGDWKRFLYMGLGRLALLVVGPFVPYAILGWFFWIVWDVRQARHAPARWVERHHGAVPRGSPAGPPRGF